MFLVPFARLPVHLLSTAVRQDARRWCIRQSVFGDTWTTAADCSAQWFSWICIVVGAAENKFEGVWTSRVHVRMYVVRVRVFCCCVCFAPNDNWHHKFRLNDVEKQQAKAAQKIVCVTDDPLRHTLNFVYYKSISGSHRKCEQAKKCSAAHTHTRRTK